MNHPLIERYVYDVTRRLPEAMREEVAKELRANAADMLPENPAEADVKKVLETLGDPRELAAGYRGKPRYLIGPKWIDDYFQVLKIVLAVFGSVALVFGLLDALLHPEAEEVIEIIAEVFGKTISGVVEGLFSAFALVTLIFAGIEAGSAKTSRKPWTTECLPALPTPKGRKISRAESIAGIIVTAIFGTIFVWLLYNNQLYIGWFEDENFTHFVAPLFNDAVIRPFIPLYAISVVLTVGSHAVNLKVGKWNAVTAAVHTVEQLFSIIVFVIFIKQDGLLATAFLDQASSFFSITNAEILAGFAEATTGIATFLGLCIAIDVISTWVKALKPARNVSVK